MKTINNFVPSLYFLECCDVVNKIHNIVTKTHSLQDIVLVLCVNAYLSIITYLKKTTCTCTNTKRMRIISFIVCSCATKEREGEKLLFDL